MADPRHRWLRLREHLYICPKCGTCKKNVHARNGTQWEWHTIFETPDGNVLHQVPARVPPCSPGPKTDAILRWHAVDKET